MRKDDTNVFAAVAVTIAIVAASIEPIVVKLGYERQLLPMQLLVVKTLVGALLIFPLTRTFEWVGGFGFLRMLFLAVLLLINSGLVIYALQRLSAVFVITIISTTPALVAICNQALGRDRLSAKFWIGFLLSFGGVALGLEWKDLHGTMSGFVLMAGAVAISTVYRVTMEATTKQYTPALVSTYLFLINGIIAAAILPPMFGQLPGGAWQIGGWMGLAAACANVAFLYAINLLGSTKTSIILLLQRPAVIVAAALILREPLSAVQLLGVVFVLGGVPLAQSGTLKVPSKGIEVSAEATNGGTK